MFFFISPTFFALQLQKTAVATKKLKTEVSSNIIDSELKILKTKQTKLLVMIIADCFCIIHRRLKLFAGAVVVKLLFPDTAAKAFVIIVVINR